MKKIALLSILVLSFSVGAGDPFPVTAEQWFDHGRHKLFSVHQQQQAIMAAIMLKMEELAPMLNLECDVNGAYYYNYKDKDHKGQFWTNSWEGNSDSDLDLANRTCLEYIYRELNRFIEEGKKQAKEKVDIDLDSEANWMKSW